MKKIIPGLLSFLIIINLFVPVNAEQSTINSSEFSKWQIGKIVSTNNLNRVACFQNKLYVAIGANGTILTSPDGGRWTKNSCVSNNINSELDDIICTDDQIVIAGEKGTILRSTDGFNWIVIKPVTNNLIRKIIYGNNLFLAFTDKQGEVLTSVDGICWNMGKTPLKQSINDASWNGKVFVTVGADGEVCTVSTSKNGLVWTPKILKNKPSFQKVSWNGKMFVSYGTTTVSTNEYSYTSGQYLASSKDGYSWSIKTIKTKSIKKDSPEIYFCSCQNIIWNGKSFIIILIEATSPYVNDQSGLITYTSNNGLDWKRIESNIGGSSIVTAWTGKEFVAVCNYYTHPGYFYGYDIFYSKDCVNWKKVIEENKDDHNANDIIYSNGKIISVGGWGEIRSSADGINWNENENIHCPQLWNGKRFITIDANTHYIYSSIDGLTWKKENKIDWNITYGNIYWTGKEYITFGPNYYISTSKDLITWDKTKYDYTSILYNNIGSISAFATDGNRYVLAGPNGTAVSSDMKNWVSRKAANCYKSVIIGESSFVALNIYGQIDVSVDGLKWKRIKIKDYNNTISKIIYADDKFIGVGTNGDVWYSKDGATWSKTDSTVNKTLNDICWTGNDFIAAGVEGTVVTSKDGVGWKQQESPLKLNFSNICLNGEIVIINSMDGFIYKSLKSLLR
jgi:photosystem II stability/assembly factor-like uncharacterized protein